MRAYMFDTNVFNHILDGSADIFPLVGKARFPPAGSYCKLVGYGGVVVHEAAGHALLSHLIR